MTGVYRKLACLGTVPRPIAHLSIRKGIRLGRFRREQPSNWSLPAPARSCARKSDSGTERSVYLRSPGRANYSQPTDEFQVLYLPSELTLRNLGSILR